MSLKFVDLAKDSSIFSQIFVFLGVFGDQQGGIIAVACFTENVQKKWTY
jgi:hypothetical protein